LTTDASYRLDDHVHSADGFTSTSSGFLWADDDGFAAFYATDSQFVIERVEFATLPTPTPTPTTTTTVPGGTTASISVIDDTATLSGTASSVAVDVLANDGASGDAIDPSSVSIATQPMVGSVEIGDGGVITFAAPATVEHTSVGFDYRACTQGGGACASGTVVVAVGRRFLAPSGGRQFDDVAPGRYYTTPVGWMVANGITTGTSPTTFSPDKCVTRGELAAFLYRLVEPTSTSTVTGFADVGTGEFYSAPVAWLVSQGITTGTSPTTFSPGRCVTRGELATFFLRLVDIDWTGTETPFTDVDRSAFYAAGVAWMVDADITEGTSPTTFSPDDSVTRAQFAAFTYRLAVGTDWRP
jgi:hypothetical protein